MKLFFKIFAFFTLLLGNLVEIIFTRILVIKPQSSLLLLILTHVCGCILVTIGLALWKLKIIKKTLSETNKENEASISNPMFVPAFFLSFFMPIFGPATVTILGLMLKPVEKKESEVFDDYVGYVKLAKDDKPRFPKLSEDMIILQLMDVEPVVDLIHSNSKKNVWGSIDNLSKRTDQTSVSLIRESIQQDDAEIKFLASIGLEKMEKQLQEKLDADRKALQEKSDLASHLEFIKTSISYLNSNLVPIRLNGELIDETMKVLNQAIKDSLTDELLFYKAQILYLTSELKSSSEIFSGLIENKKLKDYMFPLAMEVLFQCGKISMVRKLVKEFSTDEKNEIILDGTHSEIDLAELQEFWSTTSEEVPL